jgi:act minimal PKS acyl carrier protein
VRVLTLDDLVRLLRESADQDETVEIDPEGDVADISFEDLGYDSLALFNTQVRIEKDYGIQLSYDAVADTETPAEFLKLVNAVLAEAV